MRKMLLVVLLALAGLVRAEDFTAAMTPEERAATGIGRLTPAELDRLKAVVERYKSGEVTAVRQEAQQQVAVAKQEAEQKVAVVKQEAEQKVAVVQDKLQAAETKAQAAESKAQAAEAKQEPARKGPGWLGALITLKKAGEKPSASDAIESRLVGTLKNFRGARSFTLENGQVWAMTEGDSYAGPALTSPALNVTPGFLGTYWLQIPEAGLRVKVKPIKLE